MNRHLFHPDGRPVKVGDPVTSFRGEAATVTGWDKTGRNRVYVSWSDGQPGSEYYVSVFDLSWDQPCVSPR
ncbi:hypothetical protein [Mesorhizobium sp. B2-4-1]|uniref:hypothetical protein n=1 Tax=Mesorhizobium sp. B2-4-1 TaxID=2589948 RepID=UPI001125DC99|nr:hypothetical protein [Mesorhizobium sp. B2-4-1]TPL66598.1 hypothetical protein FJ949_09535 [Mesorhizobium sp. B2-4-1]